MSRLLPRGQNCAILSLKAATGGFALLYIVMIVALLVLLAGGAVTSLLVQRRVVGSSEARKVAHYRSESAVVELQARLQKLRGDPDQWKKLQRQLFLEKAVAGLEYFPETRQQFDDGSQVSDLRLTSQDGNRLTISATSECQGAKSQLHSVYAMAPFFSGLLVTTGKIVYHGSEGLLDPVAAGGSITGLASGKKWEKALFAPPYWQEDFWLTGDHISADEVLDVSGLHALVVNATAGENLRLEGLVRQDILVVVSEGTSVELGQLSSASDNILTVVADDIATTASQGYDGIRMLLVARRDLHLAHQGQVVGTFVCLGDVASQIEVEESARLVYAPPSLGWLKTIEFATGDTFIRVYSENKRQD